MSAQWEELEKYPISVEFAHYFKIATPTGSIVVTQSDQPALTTFGVVRSQVKPDANKQSICPFKLAEFTVEVSI